MYKKSELSASKTAEEQGIANINCEQRHGILILLAKVLNASKLSDLNKYNKE